MPGAEQGTPTKPPHLPPQQQPHPPRSSPLPSARPLQNSRHSRDNPRHSRGRGNPESIKHAFSSHPGDNHRPFRSQEMYESLTRNHWRSATRVLQWSRSAGRVRNCFRSEVTTAFGRVGARICSIPGRSGWFRAVSGVCPCGRMREKARASDAGLRPRRAVRQLDGADDVVDRALEQQLRLAFGQARVANLAVAQHTL